jgi:gliding motility-associated-like protein
MKPYLLQILLAFLSFVPCQQISAQEFPQLEWAKSVGLESNDNSRSITTDATGNVFVVGRFHNTVDFDPGPGVFNLTAVGFDNRGPFIMKLGTDGSFLWARTLTSTLYCFLGSIATDAAGNLYLTGSFDGTVDFDPGPGTFNITNSGSFDSNFLCKLDASGNFLWATNTVSNNTQGISSITVDAAQNVYTLGHFRGTVDFDPGAGSFTLSPLGQYDVFITKTDANGNFIYTQRLGGTSFDFGGSISTDNGGNVYVSGTFQGTADFDPGAGTFNMTSSGLRDVFIVKLTPDGNFVWAKMLGGATTDELGLAIKTDTNGNTYGTGLYTGTWDFDPGASVFNLTAPATAGQDFYIVKLNSSGDFVWAKSMGSATTDDRVTDLALDDSGVYAAGYFDGTGDFDPGPAEFTITGESDSYVVKLDLNGNFVWAFASGDTGSGTVTKVMALDPSGNIFVTGGFNPTLDADPDPCATFDLITGYIYIEKLSIGVAGGPCGSNLPPVILATTAATLIEGVARVDLIPILSDPDDNLDLSTLTTIGNTTQQGASATINASSQLLIDYAGVPFFGVDAITLEVCDLALACTQQQVSIEVSGDLTIYNALSPNEDDKNEIFRIQFIDILPETQVNQVSIYNRWGDEVWSGENYDNSTVVFTGKNKSGNALPSGTYFYKIVFKSTGKKQNGYLQIRR